ncbi:TRAP transporter substrate-binding protein [Georgenia sp. AZ-5]|uniref:TRAP transporter substrate-binding protein n=1 Tax=Georgenia sp. AZ-5 TaxID=3367526 RepID=UPI003754DA1C
MRRNKVVSILATVTPATLVLAACGSGSGEEGGAGVNEDSAKVFKVAFNQTETHPQYKAVDEMGDRISERTEGRYDLQVYPNETLGTQKDTLELVQAGSIEMAMVAGSLLENINPDFVVFNLPYTFDSQEHQRKTVNDPEITGELFASMEDSGVRVLVGFHGGVRSVYNGEKPIETPEDLAGMKIRVIESDTNLRMMELMGGTGTPMGQGEVYTAIQSGVIDGGENNESIYANLKHAEIAPYYSYTRHLMFPDYLVVNPAVMDGMSEEDRAVFTEELAAAIDAEAGYWGEEVEKSVAAAKEAGAQFNEVDADAFRAALTPLIEESLTTDTQKALYEAVRAGAE